MENKKENLKPNEVVAPTLFVGVGGTGCKIVKKVADLCAPEEKENINFLCLDTNVNDLSDVANGKSQIYWVQTSNTQTVGSYLDYDEEARKKWFPKNAVMYDKTVSEGAGQVRAISRLALNSTIKTGRIRPLYDSIDDLFRKTGKDMKQAMRVVIASTASGGTGSGIILPLTMFIRDYVKEKYPNTSLIVRSLILLPETLDSVIDSQTERDSQARNAYATIKELNAFMMKGSGFIDLDEDLKQFSNLHVNVSIAGSDKQKALSLLPMDFCFLMDGQDAEDSTMISIGQYIEQAAQALYEQNIGPMQKKAFSVEDNIIKEMTKPGNYGRNRFGGIGAGVIRYPYEKVADYVSYDLAIDSIGGEGDATKWTKYDHAVQAYKAEQKKRGVPMSTWDSDGKVYCDTLHNAKDSFSRDLNNTYELDGIDSRIKRFKKSFEDQVYRVVLNDKRFNSIYNSAKQWESSPAFGESENKIADAVDSLSEYRNVVRLRNENGGDTQVFEQVSVADAQRHIAEVVAMGARIAAPSIQRATNEEPREIKVCAYNKILLDNRKFRVKDLIPNGEAVDTVSKYEIHFYNALYNLTPNKLKKFAAPFETETGKKGSGTYHKAYTEYSRLIGPDSTKNAAISTHIDKRWDSIKSMPELDFDYQQLVIQKIHKAFIYGLVHHAIQQRPLSAVANGKKVFLYRDSDNRDVELQVPNGTLCDEFYEILDALYVNSKVVEDINLIKNRKRVISEAKNCNYESTEFFRDMAKFNLLHLLGVENAKTYDSCDGTQKSLEDLKIEIQKNKEERCRQQEQERDLADLRDDGRRYVENARLSCMECGKDS